MLCCAISTMIQYIICIRCPKRRAKIVKMNKKKKKKRKSKIPTLNSKADAMSPRLAMPRYNFNVTTSKPCPSLFHP